MTKKSQWDKGIEIYKEELKDLLEERLEEKGFSLKNVKKLSYKEASGYILGLLIYDFVDIEKNNRLEADLLRWIRWSEGGGFYIYEDDIKEILFTPSEKNATPATLREMKASCKSKGGHAARLSGFYIEN